MNSNCKIAFLGMGLMGKRMAKRLLDAHFSVAVWNRTPSACDELYQYGANVLSLDEIASFDVILLCLADDAAVESVFNQIKNQLRAGQIIVDFSSLSVHKTQFLAQQAQLKQVTWIDSPVSGGTTGAEQGTLIVFAGGHAQTIDQLTPIYQSVAQRVTHMGETGTGQATKICNQLIVAANSTLIAEAIALAKKAGVNAALLAPALKDGFADSKPFQILSPRMANHIFEPVQWKVQTLSKDLNNAVQLAAELNLNIPVAKQALNQLSTHANQGFANADLASLICQIEQ